jgi:16S rRNA (cytidine1402-2'-O)-methyltransferase
MPGTLHVIATPIGNLEDITLRALKVLRQVSVVAAEDTRRTARLLAHYEITTPTLSYHEHNRHARLPQLLKRLVAGEDVAVVTDAGTPAISDPGQELVRACIEAGVGVNPVPGASAPLAAAVASGFPLAPLTVFGFVPSRSNDRNYWFQTVSGVSHTFCFFESPLRIIKTLEEAVMYFGERPMCLAREITKVHQEFLRGSAATVRAQLSTTKGEFTVVVGPSYLADEKSVVAKDQDVADMLAEMGRFSGESRGELISRLAKRCNWPRREVYAAIERAKKCGE